MQLSKRCEYALRALIDLAVAESCGKATLSLSALARYEGIPLKFLEQIFIQLRKAGYVKSKRGPSGGYALAKLPAKIHFGDIVRLIDGPLAPIRCASRTAYQKCSCPSEEQCGLHLLMTDLRSSISNVLDRTSLANMVRRVSSKGRRGKKDLLLCV